MAVKTFHVALTADFFGADGTPCYRDMGLGVLDEYADIKWRRFKEHRPEIEPEQLDGAAAVIVLTPRVTARSVSDSRELLAIARFGVGYDSVDVPACTAADVLVLIASGSVDRSVAEAALAWMLALSHHVRAKDRLVRQGAWNERTGYMGCELRDRVLGVVGLGGIGRELVRLTSGLGMRQPLAYDPLVPASSAEAIGVRLVSLDELLSNADFVSLHCPLNDSTRNLIGPRELALMKPSAYLINTARGGIVDEHALFAALKERRIAGAAIDCFAQEPVLTPHRLGELSFENVLLAPHCIAWTDEIFRDVGGTVCRQLVAVSRGQRPSKGIINPEVLARPGFQEKWARLRSGEPQ
jgi:phosphoglycerate dehydrogenase-like enzyme